jgi:two-component system sensor kinase FixL
MLHAGRLTDMGQVSASLAHELNQPLTAILNYTNAGLDIAEAHADMELKSVLSKVAEQASRAGNIIRRLRAFVEKREPNRSEEDIARIVDEAIRLSQLSPAERGIKLRVSVEAALPAALIDRIQIQQVLINLVKNAAEAMENMLPRELHIAVGHAAKGFLQVSVADTGPGIADDMVQKLFQPFVTTKAEGMGMGLNICRGIVESHGGRLWVEPNAGQGAIFHFTIPIAKPGKS